jgi:sulfite exporter TauE/SafE
MFLYSGFIVGFLGSFHCAGMCGPIALSLPINNESKTAAVFGKLIYNSGRILTYSLLGLLVGLAGHRIAMAGFQKSLSIGSGILIIGVAILSITSPRLMLLNGAVSKYSQKIKSLFRNLFGKKTKTTLFLIGSVNGLLPCGFVYLSLAAAIAAGNYIHSMFYMMLFGLGTLPMMFSLSYAGNLFGLRFNRFFRKLNPYVALIVAALLIYRGMSMTACGHCHH